MNETHPHSRRNVTAILLITVLALASVCEAEQDTLLFHAGAGQRASLDEIAELFRTRHPDVAVNFSYKGSGFFLADITRSREGDLYMPGEEFYFLQAVERGFIKDYDPKRDIPAHFVTVIITPRGNPQNVRTLEDFARPGMHVGLADPQAAAIGLWHEKTFKRAGIWEAVRQNATMSAKCIPELGNAAQHKLIDATIVWATTALLYLRDVEIIPLAPRHRGIVRLPVGTLDFAKQPKEAQILKDLILSDEGRAIFLSHAYAVGELPRDDDGFQADDGKATDPLMTWLVNAARAVKDDSFRADAQTVGPLLSEVVRQRKTLRAGN
jgi:molybdate transport system substrate-binding protein